MQVQRIFQVVFLLLVLPAVSFSQSKKKTDVVYIQTSAQCDECKARLQAALYAVDGVKSVELNMADKKLMVKYQPSKVQPAQLRQTVANTGYDADEVKADPVAYEKLPKCCQKGGHE